MFNLIFNLVVTFGGMFLVSYFLYSITSWRKLSLKYKKTKRLSKPFFVTKDRIYINKIPINKFNVGVSKKGLFLSFSSLMGVAFFSLLIPWNEIYYEKDIENNSRRDFVFNLGNPKIASLQLSLHTIEKIHENYGEPIFF